jgi:hypothetical protein
MFDEMSDTNTSKNCGGGYHTKNVDKAHKFDFWDGGAVEGPGYPHMAMDLYKLTKRRKYISAEGRYKTRSKMKPETSTAVGTYSTLTKCLPWFRSGGVPEVHKPSDSESVKIEQTIRPAEEIWLMHILPL